MNNLFAMGVELLTASEMESVRGGYQLIWDFRDSSEKVVDNTPQP
jgi:hypothetical protein